MPTTADFEMRLSIDSFYRLVNAISREGSEDLVKWFGTKAKVATLPDEYVTDPYSLDDVEVVLIAGKDFSVSKLDGELNRLLNIHLDDDFSGALLVADNIGEDVIQRMGEHDDIYATARLDAISEVDQAIFTQASVDDRESVIVRMMNAAEESVRDGAVEIPDQLFSALMTMSQSKDGAKMAINLMRTIDNGIPYREALDEALNDVAEEAINLSLLLKERMEHDEDSSIGMVA